MDLSPGSSSYSVRPCRPTDRPVLRAICGDTGFLGQPIDPVFEDRELFADYLTSYYTDVEPESTFVCELDGEVKGYLMGSRFPRRKQAYERRTLPRLVVRGLWRYVTRPYNAASRRYVRWIVTQARHEQPFTPPDMPHFHVNVRPEVRSLATTRLLVDRYLQYLADQGDKEVYGQVVVQRGRRGERMFTRFGFRVVDRREVTKYREMHSGQVQLVTVVKDLTQNVSIFGNDVHGAGDAPLQGP